MNHVVDFDDLCDNVADRSLSVLLKIKEKIPPFVVTLFTIPQRTSDATITKYKEYPWIALAPHGWRHTRGECLGWTTEEATAKITAARGRGIDAPAFRAPAWLLDAAVYQACGSLGITICDHKQFHSYVPDTLVYRYNDPNGRAKKTRAVHGHLTNTPAIDNFIGKLLVEGNLNFHPKQSFVFPWDVAVPNPVEVECES